VTDPAFTLTPRSSRSFTHAHTNTDTPTRTPALTPRLIPTPLIVAAGCPKGHYRTECGWLKFPGDSSDTRIQHVQSHMASQCDLLHGQEPTTRRSPASPVYFNPGTTRAIAGSVRWATSKRTPGRARAGACLKWLSLWEGAQPPPRPLCAPGLRTCPPCRCKKCGTCGDGERRTSCGGINGDASDPVLAETTATLPTATLSFVKRGLPPKMSFFSPRPLSLPGEGERGPMHGVRGGEVQGGDQY
jgi:hypothetical protein